MATVSSGSNYLCRHSNYEHFRHGVLAGMPGTENRAESRGQRRLNPKPQLPKRREQLCERRRGARLEMRKKVIEEAGRGQAKTRGELAAAYRRNWSSPAPPWYNGPTKRIGDPFNHFVRSPFPCTVRDPTNARVDVGRKLNRTDQGPVRAPGTEDQDSSIGRSALVLSPAGCPRQMSEVRSSLMV